MVLLPLHAVEDGAAEGLEHVLALGIEAHDPHVLPDVGYEAARALIRRRGILLPFGDGRIRDRALRPRM